MQSGATEDLAGKVDIAGIRFAVLRVSVWLCHDCGGAGRDGGGRAVPAMPE